MNRNIIVIIFITLLTSGCKETIRDKIFDDSRAKFVQNGNQALLDLNTITDFKWDSLYIFTPSTQPAVFEKYFHDKLSWKDLTFQLVFTHQGKIVYTESEQYSPEKPLGVDFILPDSVSYLIIESKNALFKIEKEPTKNELYTLRQANSTYTLVPM